MACNGCCSYKNLRSSRVVLLLIYLGCDFVIFIKEYMKRILSMLLLVIVCISPVYLGCCCNPADLDFGAASSNIGAQPSKELESSLLKFIQTDDWRSLDVFLESINEQDKKVLLSKEITVTFLGEEPWEIDPLNIAVEYGYCEVIKVLVRHGADINKSSSDGYTPLTRTVDGILPDIANMITLLVSLGANINACDEGGDTALSIAVEGSRVDLIHLLVKLGADVNLQNSCGDTVLRIAVEESLDDIIPILVDHGADGNLRNSSNKSPAALAVFYGKKDLAKLLLKDQEPCAEDIMCAVQQNDVAAFSMFLNFCKTNNPLLDPDKAPSIVAMVLAYGNRAIVDSFFDWYRQANSDFANICIIDHNPIHFIAMYGHDELLRHLIEDHLVDINQMDGYGLTALHYACMYGHYKMVKYLIGKKCLINSASSQDFYCYKKESTPCDIAMQLGYGDIVSLLLKHGATVHFDHKRCTVSKQSDHLAIFLDFTCECPQDKQRLISVGSALSIEVYDIIKQKACPVIIIGQHMLRNALLWPCSLKDWIVIDISRGNVDGYIIVPKKLIGIPVNAQSRTLLDTKMQALGFSLSSIRHEYVDEAAVRQKEISDEMVEPAAFSAQAVEMIEALLLPRKRFIYWGGHGTTVSTVGGLLQADASKLLKILASKETKIVYVLSCFFAGKKFEAIDNFDDMIVMSAATAELAVKVYAAIEPINLRAFFNTLSDYSGDSSSGNPYEYIANNVLPHLITHNPDITNFPHIKFPGKPITLLPVNGQAMFLNSELLDAYPANDSIIVDNKRLLEVDVPYVKNPIEIRNIIPLIISNKSKNVFEEMYLENNKDVDGFDFVHILEGFVAPTLFYDSFLENVFLIKKLTLSTNVLLSDEEKEYGELPKILYNLVIRRGPGNRSFVFFSTNKSADVSNSFFATYDTNKKCWQGYAPTHFLSEVLMTYNELLAKNS